MKFLAQGLGYSNEDSVTKVYNHNILEFTAKMAQTIEKVNLTGLENLKTKLLIFSLRGAHLIAMFARTKIAKKFRKWVLDILDKEVSEIIQPESFEIYSAQRVKQVYARLQKEAIC